MTPIGPATAIDGRFWRMLSVRRQRESRSGAGAAASGGRWNRPGQPALYLSADHATAILDFHQNLVRPGTLAAYDICSERIVDLTGPDAAPAATLFSEWRTMVAITRQDPPSWGLVDRALAAGIDGLLVPSAQLAGGINLVLWRWSDATGDGVHVRLIDPRGDLTPR